MQELRLFLRYLYYAVAHSEHQGVQLGMYLKLGQDVRHVAALCPLSYVKPLGDLFAVQALG